MQELLAAELELEQHIAGVGGHGSRFERVTVTCRVPDVLTPRADGQNKLGGVEALLKGAFPAVSG